MPFALLTCLAFFPSIAFGADGDIHHLAGGGVGDGAPATNAIVNPLDVVLDRFGNIIIADDSRVRKIEPTGVIRTIVGTGMPGFSGDGDLATSAQISFASGVMFLASGELIIADSQNHRLRKVDSNGVITTIAGDGFGEGYYWGGRFQGDGGQASQASLNQPSGLASDAAGNIYVADTGNDRIRKISPEGLITTIAGGGPHLECPEPAMCLHGDGGLATLASLDRPRGVAVDHESIYIADTGHGRIRRVDNLGRISTVAGLGVTYKSGIPAFIARMERPIDLSMTAKGDLFVSHGTYNGELISRIDSDGFIWHVAGGGNWIGDDVPADKALLSSGGLFAFTTDNLVHESEVLFAEHLVYSTGYLRKVASGRVTRIAGNGERTHAGDGGPAATAGFSSVWGIEIASDGSVLVADWGNGRIRKIDTRGEISTIGGDGSHFWGGDGGPATMATIHYPHDFVFDATGSVYVSESLHVRKIDPNGVISTVAGNGPYVYNGDNIPATQASLQGPVGLAFDSANNLYIADASGSRVRKVDPSGIITTFAGTGEAGNSGDGGPATEARLVPWGLAIDASDNLYISDPQHNVIRRIDPSGQISTVAGTGTEDFHGDGGPPLLASFSQPRGLAFDQGGNLYVADFGNHRVRKIENNVVITVAGNGTNTLSGDEGPALTAGIAFPTDVATFPDGRLLISSRYGRVRWVE